MKIIEGLKKIKHYDRKIEKSKARITANCSILINSDNPPSQDVISNMSKEVNAHMKRISDWTEEKLTIRHALHKINMEHKVTVRGKEFTLDELLLARSMSIPTNIEVLKCLRRKEKGYSSPPNVETLILYDPNQRDKAIDDLEYFQEEIDNALDQANITVDLPL